MTMLNLILLWANSPDESAFLGLTAGEVATYGIAIVLILLAITLFLAVVGPLLYSFLNIGTSWKGIAAIAGIFILAFIAYSMSSGDLLAQYGLERDVSASQSKLIDAVLFLFWILFIPAAVLLLVSILWDVLRGFVK